MNKVLENMEPVLSGVEKKNRERTISYVPTLYQALCSHFSHLVSFTKAL